MKYLLFFLISFLSSTVGSICGVGGGVIIKPVLDAVGILSVSAISFLSSCTVLAMSCSSTIKNKRSGVSCIRMYTTLPLAIGAAFGGVAGKMMFNLISALFADADRIGAIQAFILAILCVVILLYTLNKAKIHTLQVSSRAACMIIGLVLGIISSFLGIGGGPVDLIVLLFFFSMSLKEAAQNSICIIFFAQLANLAYTIIGGTLPAVSPFFLVVMVFAGIIGGIAGSAVNKKIDEDTVDHLFVALLIAIVCINIFNIFKFLG